MKKLITIILILYSTVSSFSQIEKVDTLINVDLNLSASDIILDLDKDGTDDVLFDNKKIGSTYNCLFKSLNNKVKITIDTIYAVPTSPLNSTIFLRLGNRCGTNTNYLYYPSINILYKSAVTKPPSVYSTGKTLVTGENLIPLNLVISDSINNNYKSIIFKINKDSIVEKYSIKGWYINHTLNEPLSCNLVYNDSIINSYTTGLPVELVQFNVEARTYTVELNWQTASEENNKGFEIQRSHDGIDFEVIGFVEGNGTIFEYSNYSFIDRNPINGTNYYRLRQIDFNGDFDYSQIEAVEFTKVNPSTSLTGFLISPNPAKDFIKLNISFEIPVEFSVKITDVTGRIMETRYFKNTAGKEMIFDLNNFSTGTYFMQAVFQGKVITKRFSVIK